MRHLRQSAPMACNASPSLMGTTISVTAPSTVASTASRREGLPLVCTSPISHNGVSKKKGCMYRSR